MRISDWSSDVCSSDLEGAGFADDIAVDIVLHEARRGDLLEEITVAVDQEPIVLAGHAGREVGIDQVRHAELVEDAIERREIAARLPLGFADIVLLSKRRHAHIALAAVDRVVDRRSEWCRRQDSNPRHLVYKTSALPTELHRHSTDPAIA